MSYKYYYKLEDARVKYLRLLGLIMIIAMIACFVRSCYYNKYQNNANKTPVVVTLNDDTKEAFEHQFNRKLSLCWNYTYDVSEDSTTSDIVLSSDISDINIDEEYSVEAFSPLVVCLNDSSDLLEKYIVTKKNSNGFLQMQDGHSRDSDGWSFYLECDFNKIINVVNENQNWSSLGGSDSEITIYCPPLNSVEGDLFYDFLLITINNGRYPTDNLPEIEKIADNFLNSPNVVQTDVEERLLKLGDDIPNDEIYITFESNLLISDLDDKVTITFPTLTVIKQVFLQFNNKEVETDFVNSFESWDWCNNSLLDTLHNLYYRTVSEDQFEFQYSTYETPGFNYYELYN